MDLDREFVAAILRGGAPAFKLAIEKGIDPDIHVIGEGRVVWNYILDHKKQYGEIPSAELINGKFGIDTSCSLPDGVGVVIDELLKRRIFGVVQTGAIEVTNKLESLDPIGAAEQVSEIHRKLRKEKLTTAKIESLWSYMPNVWQQYKDVKAGKRGIATPWPTMTENTMGWVPEDLILFVGRLGVGKTFMLLLIAHVAWASGKKVLFVSTEMSKTAMAERLFAMNLKLSYRDLRKGRLGDFLEQDVEDRIAGMMANTGIDIVGGAFDFTISNVEAAIEESECDIACVDGAYLIKSQGKDRHERVSNTFDELARIGKGCQIAIATNNQFNRQAKTGKTKTLAAENIGMTDVAGFNSHYIYAIDQDDDMRAARQMKVKSLKVRNGEPHELLSRWDFEKMDFSEIRDADAPPVVSATTVDPDDVDMPF